MDRYSTSGTSAWHLISSSVSSAGCVPLPVFSPPLVGSLCVKAGSHTAIFDFSVSSLTGSFSLRESQKWCLPPHPFHYSRCSLARTPTDSSCPRIHVFLTPSFTVLPHWSFFVPRSVTSLLINLQTSQVSGWTAEEMSDSLVLHSGVPHHLTAACFWTSTTVEARCAKLCRITSFPSTPVFSCCWACLAVVDPS